MKRIGWYLPSAFLISIVFIYPAVRTIVLSFTHINLANSFAAEFAGLQNFSRLLSDFRFHNSIVVTAMFTAVSVAIEFMLALLLALAVHPWIRGRNAVRTILLIPWTLPTAIIAVLWAWIFNDQLGILNSLLVRAGLLDAPVAWLATPLAAMAAVIVADVWKTTPFAFIILLAGLQSIPQDLYEAVEMDGGGAWAKFRYVTWPFLAPFAFVALVFRGIQAFAIFDLVYVMTGGGPGGATETVSVYVYQTLMRYLDFGYGSAMAVVMVAFLGASAAVMHRLVMRAR
jgi:multiple sugar transport system permease protein